MRSCSEEVRWNAKRQVQRMTTETLLELHDLAKRFGPIAAVDGLSFSVGRGEVLGFLGPNGAGKSTTMKIIT